MVSYDNTSITPTYSKMLKSIQEYSSYTYEIVNHFMQIIKQIQELWNIYKSCNTCIELS